MIYFSTIYFRTFTLLSILLFAGCVGPRVATHNTAFYTGAYAPRGAISVVPAEQQAEDSLEFAAYKKAFETQLGKVGYEIVDDAARADYIALVSYDIDQGETTTVTIPVYGYTRWGSGYLHDPYFYPHHRFGHFRSHYFMAYDVVGHSTDTITVYNRTIALDIVDASSFRRGTPHKMYEGRTKSTGRCPVLAEVFDEMLTAMFSDFPGENGRNRKQVVAAELNC